MRHLVALFIVLLTAAGVGAEGLVTKDLTGIEQPVQAALGPGCMVRAEPKQLTGRCQGDAGELIVSIQLSRQTDGTEARIRSGATKVADLERLCQARNAACTLSALEVAPAIGWVTAYPVGRSAGATVVIIRDGDMLILRSMTDDPVVARALIDQLLPVLRAKAIGL